MSQTDFFMNGARGGRNMERGDQGGLDRKTNDRHSRRTLFWHLRRLSLLDFLRRLRRLSPAKRREVARVFGAVFLRSWLRWSFCGGILRVCMPTGGAVERLAGCRPLCHSQRDYRPYHGARNASPLLIAAGSDPSNVEGDTNGGGRTRAAEVNRFSVSASVLILTMAAAFISLLIFAAAWAS